MATNKLGPGTVNIGVNVPEPLRAELEQLAKLSKKKLGAYVRAVLQDAADSKTLYRAVKTQDSAGGATHTADEIIVDAKRRQHHAATQDGAGSGEKRDLSQSSASPDSITS